LQKEITKKHAKHSTHASSSTAATLAGTHAA
jgi:hypothetical protein